MRTLCKLAGRYEMEIADAVEDAVTWRPDMIVDLGCAEGYYAVGLALRVPSATVIAYDLRRSARWLTRQLAKLNDVQVDVRGEASKSTLQRDLERAERPLLICDVDGGEGTLIDVEQVPALADVRLVIETHDCIVSGITDLLTRRLDPTHRVVRVDSEPRQSSLLPQLAPQDAALALNEHRPAQSWLVCLPRAGSERDIGAA